MPARVSLVYLTCECGLQLGPSFALQFQNEQMLG